MSTLIRKEIRINEEQNYKCSVYYEKGIKYWLVVVPIKLVNRGSYIIEEFGAFTGLKTTLIDMNGSRKSKLSTQKAIEKADEMIPKMIEEIKLKKKDGITN